MQSLDELEITLAPIVVPPINIFTVPLNEFCDKTASHLEGYIVNGIEYDSLMASHSNLYFYCASEERVTNQYLIIFEEILDIKQRTTNDYTIFCYPDTQINISLRKLDE